MMLRYWGVDASVSHIGGRLLNMERGHRLLQHREIDGNGNRFAASSLVATWAVMHGHAKRGLLKHGEMRVCHVIRLRGRPGEDGRNRCRRGHSMKVEMAVAIAKGLQRDQFRELTAQLPWVAAKVVYHDLGGLLLFSEISTLVEAAGTR